MSKQNRKILTIALALIMAGSLVFLTGCGSTQRDNGQGNGQNNGGGNVGGLKPIDAADHVRGSLDAPVKMIVYSDFECPFCSKFADTMKQVEENFKDKVVIAFRHYPLAGHPEGLPAAEASECAAEQGKFWEMHDKLFADNKAGRLSADQYKKDAGDLGLDAAKFSQCLDSGKYKNKVETDIAEGERAGVTGTPTSFVNGNIYPGAYPFEDFTASNGDKEDGMQTIINKLLQ